jgi:S-adenosyl-L-methionine hydrolase (adenosine-forming)
VALSGRRRSPRLVTLTSDVGAAYAAQMKAVLLRSIGPSRIVDLAQDLPAHGIEEAAFLLRAMAHGFPAGTVHLVVVDPGVGGKRAPIVIECSEGSCLVGPDNGVLYPLAEELGIRAAFRIEPGRVTRGERLGATFDGRDLFAPAAVLLARGRPPRALGPRVDPWAYHVPMASPHATGGSGAVVHRDHFGNLVTNVPSTWAPPDCVAVRVRLGRRPAFRVRLVQSYEELGRGRLGAVPSSFGTLELAVDQGRADEQLDAGVGTPIRFAWIRRAGGGVTVNNPRTRLR